MKVAEIPFVVLRFQYQIARLPLQLIEDQVVARLHSEGPARLLYERSFGALDATVGKLLGDPQLEKRGAALVERSNALGKAAKLDATATLNRQQADAKLEATHDEVVTDINEARDATRRRAVEARTNAEQRKRAADEAAEKRKSPPRIRPTKQRLSATKQPRQSSASKRRKSERPRRGPRKPPSPSSTTLKRNAARLQASARRPTGSRSWPTSKSRSAVPIASTTADGWGCAAVWVPTPFASGTDVALAESCRSPNTHYGSADSISMLKRQVSADLDVDINAATTLEFQIAVAPQRGQKSPSRCCSRRTASRSRRWRSAVCMATASTSSRPQRTISRSVTPPRSSVRPIVRRSLSTT